MSVLNQLYLSELSKQYKIESVEMFEFGFSSYCISPNKREHIYLLLCDNWSSSFDVYFVLDKLSLIESSSKEGNCYLCIMPADNPIIDLCTHCNGKSFVHFIFPDKHAKSLIYDKNFYYCGGKQVKRLMDIFQNCFNELNRRDN